MGPDRPSQDVRPEQQGRRRGVAYTGPRVRDRPCLEVPANRCVNTVRQHGASASWVKFGRQDGASTRCVSTVRQHRGASSDVKTSRRTQFTHLACAPFVVDFGPPSSPLTPRPYPRSCLALIALPWHVTALLRRWRAPDVALRGDGGSAAGDTSVGNRPSETVRLKPSVGTKLRSERVPRRPSIGKHLFARLPSHDSRWALSDDQQTDCLWRPTDRLRRRISDGRLLTNNYRQPLTRLGGRRGDDRLRRSEGRRELEGDRLIPGCATDRTGVEKKQEKSA